MNSHTPGPWEVFENDDGDVSIAMGSALGNPSRYYFAADMWTCGGEYGENKAMSNAHLIAAAPEMYEVCQQIVAAATVEMPVEIIKAAESALAKAEGRDE